MLRRWTRRCLAWRDRADSTPCLPKEEPYASFELLLPARGLCLPTRCLEPNDGLDCTAASFSRRQAELSSRDTSFLVPASRQLDVLPRVVSDRRGFLSSAGEGCPEEVWSMQWLIRPSCSSAPKSKAELQWPCFHSSSTTVAVATGGCWAHRHPEEHHSLKVLCGAPVASQ